MPVPSMYVLFIIIIIIIIIIIKNLFYNAPFLDHKSATNAK